MQLPPFEPVFPVPLIAASTGAMAVFAIVRAFRGYPLNPGWLQVPALLLRLLAIAVLGILLLNPSHPIQISVPASHSIVLLDKSASMSLGPPGGPTRWETAVQFVKDVSRDAVSAGLPAPQILPFDSSVRPPATDLADIKPGGTESNLAHALEQTLASTSGAPPDHILIVSDGDARDRARLPAALALAAAQEISISTHVVGTDTPPRNVWIASVNAPRIVRPGSRVAARVSIAANGFRPRDTLALTLKDTSGAVLAQSYFHVPEGGASEETPVERLLTFDAGLRTGNYTLEVSPAAGEVSLEDNAITFPIEVANTRLRVLFVEGTHVKRSLGNKGHAINDIELMTRAWDATGAIEADVLTPISEYLNRPNLVGVRFANGEMIPDPSRSFPARREDLYNYDVMLISDVPVGNFSEDQMQWVVDWVTERGGGFLMGGGFTTFDPGRYDKTPWEKIIPVDMVEYGAGYDTSYFDIAIPEAVRNHPIWRISQDPEENERILATHPPFTGMNRIHRAKPGATVFATRPNRDNEPVFAGQQYGRGRSIAYLPDPNGGWARYFVHWGPPGSTPLGAHQEVGHGSDFKVDESAVRAAVGPVPPYPSAYYGQFWVNVVNWLGENSIRWRREKLAGRVIPAQARPGRELPVAVEVLAVTKPEELLALDVGARLDTPGSKRLRLEYDRDRHEFLGSVPLPTDVQGSEASVLFDVTIAGQSLTDTARVGIRRANPEYVDSTPDRAFLAELASAARGGTPSTSAEAVAALRKAARERASHERQTWWQPLWTTEWWWMTIMALLSVEWMLRRLGGRPVATPVAAVLLACLAPCVQAAELAPTAKTADAPQSEDSTAIGALVLQLGARYVRQRDEAEAGLKALFPRSSTALADAATHSSNPEIRLRAASILRSFRQNRWQLEKTLSGHDPGAEIAGIAVAPYQRSFFTRGQDGIRKWDAETLEPGIQFGEDSHSLDGWEVFGTLTTLDVSHDGKLVASTDDFGTLIIHSTSDGKERLRIPRGTGSRLWSAQFFSDNRHVATSDRNGGLSIWDIEKRKLLNTEHTRNGYVLACALAISPDSRFIVCSLDLPGEPDSVWVYDRKKGRWCANQEIPYKISNVQFNREGTAFVGGSRGGTALLWRIDAQGRISIPRRIGSFNTEAYFAIFSRDEKSLIVATEETSGELTEWDIASGEEIWRSLPLDVQLRQVELLGDDRIVATASDGKVRVWRRQSVP